ncbi:U2AF35A [Symbiodinium sp. CCMP2592]|nr:U2AF35A [Symbiodinium sp. CCMP2592]
MERSHKTDPDQHRSVDPEKFHISANGWKKFDNKEANRVGNYNVLLAGCPAAVYDAENITWEQSHVLRGNKTPEELKGAQDRVGAGSVEGCPHLATLQAKDS